MSDSTSNLQWETDADGDECLRDSERVLRGYVYQNSSSVWFAMSFVEGVDGQLTALPVRCPSKEDAMEEVLATALAEDEASS